MGRLAELWGVRRNLGRAWSVLFLRGGPLNAVELQRMLKLSTGAVSMTLNELQRWGAVRRVWRPGERRKLYEAEVDVWRVVSRLVRARELVEIDSAVDHLEGALADLRRELEQQDASSDEAEAPGVTEGEAEPDSLPSRRQELVGKISRLEDLLDLMRMVGSMLRVLVTTGRLDASALVSLRLGQSGDDAEL
jgi:DNA-binding transcriptional regulator GbsR (MarR family)